MTTIAPYMTLKEIQQGLTQEEFTSVDLVNFYLDRIHQFDSDLHAYVSVFTEQARLAAEGLDKLRQAGIVNSPLHGIPVAIKDLLALQGTKCTASSLLFEDHISTDTALTVQYLLQAGSIMLGKLQLVEFAFGSYGTNLHFGTPKNPWDLSTHRTPGGSSSGSGVAVAAGLVPVALGTDTGGSIRIPAALNGVVGFKPTQDRVSREGCLPLSDTLDSIGPLANCVDDALLVYEYLSRDTLHIGDFKQLKIAYLDPASLGTPIDPDVIHAMAQTKAQLIKAGAQVETITLNFSWAKLSIPCGDIIAKESYEWHKEWIATSPEKYNPATLHRFLHGKTISDSDFQGILQKRQEHIAMFHQLMQQWDALLLPTIPYPAIPVDTVDERTSDYSLLTRSVNYFNGCAMSLPIGLSSAGLPIGAQIVADAHQESILATLAKAIEQVMPFDHHPKGFI